MSEEISLDISMSKEKMDKIKDILGSAKGLRHYAIKLENGEYLDLVEYKDYEQLENNWNELKKWLEEYYDYGDCLKINYILKKMQEIENRKV